MHDVLHDDHHHDVQPVRRRRHRARGYSKSGFYALKTTLRVLGPRVVDRRTALGRHLEQWRGDLVRDLGGDVSTQQAAVIDVAVKTKLMLDSIDAWLLVQPSLVNARKRALLPVVRERQYLADALARYMGQLGLDRREREPMSIGEYMAQKEREQREQREREQAQAAPESEDEDSVENTDVGRRNS